MTREEIITLNHFTTVSPTLLDTTDLSNNEIYLKLSHTCESNPSKSWLPAYYFTIHTTDGTEVGYCDLRIRTPPATCRRPICRNRRYPKRQ